MPELGAVEIRLSNAEQSEGCDTEGKFKDKKADEQLGSPPLSWDRGKERRQSHTGGFCGLWKERLQLLYSVAFIFVWLGRSAPDASSRNIAVDVAANPYDEEE